MRYSGNYMIDGDDGSHPSSPYYMGEEKIEHYNCMYCDEEFPEDELYEPYYGNHVCIECNKKKIFWDGIDYAKIEEIRKRGKK